MFGDKLKGLRKASKLTQEQLANKIGVAKTTIASYEQNARTPDPVIQSKIADYFNVSLDYLHGREVPSWATNQDVLDIEKAIKDNVPMNYDGIELDEEDRAQIDRVIRAVMWEKLEARKKEKNDEQK